jgi:hypothetical protein
MKSERIAFDPRQTQDIKIFSDLPFERNDSSVAPFVVFGIDPDCPSAAECSIHDHLNTIVALFIS